MQDSYFRTPKAAYGFELVTPIANESPASAMSTELLVHILEVSCLAYLPATNLMIFHNA